MRVKSFFRSGRYPLIIMIVFLSATAISLYVNLDRARHRSVELATLVGRTLLKEQLVTGKLKSIHDGIKIPGPEGVKHNRENPKSDITSIDGMKMINPAYMQGIVKNFLGEGAGIRVRLASPRPLNPKNEADNVEAVAFAKFRRGEAEHTAIDRSEGSPRFRYIGPTKMGDTCLGCHGKRGFRKGDIGGVVDVSFSFEPFQEAIDGSAKKVHAAHIIFLGLGIILVVGMFRDIVRQQKAGENILHLATAVEQAGEVFLITDARGTIQYVNPAFEQVTGYRREEVIGSNPRILKSGMHDASFYRDMWETLSSGSVWHGRFINRKKDGTLYQEEATISPNRDEAGKIVNFVAVKRDITKEVALESQLRHAQKMEAVGQLAGGVAHDFNNIMTAIIGYASFLKMRVKKDDSLENYVVNILASAERAADLTQGLLAFGRKQVFKLEPVNINAVVRRVGNLLMRLIGEDIDLRTEYSEQNLVVMADSGQMEQVLVNLATNSRDAMPDGGVMTIKTEHVVLNNDFTKMHGYGKPGKYALISATDTGIGMDRETVEKIFEPFFTNKEVGRGTGLGLAIVYGIVKQHGGYINVESEPGMGTTFYIYLPLTEENVRDVKNQEAAVPLIGRETVLVAEDDAAVRRLIKSVLEKFGYRVLEAVDGEDAVAKFTENSGDIDLLILDVVMPRKNGKEVYDELKIARSEVKVLFMSGYAADIIYRKGLVEEGLHLLAKPIAPGELLKSVRETLDS